MAPGANYMGGKRNAARTRCKDTTGRAHKNFFSRQRLDILSKGLSGRAPSGSTSGLGPRITASDIGLSHAKHLAPNLDREDAVSRRVDTSTPSRSTHLTEETRSHMRSSSGSRSSKILEALDTTEPLAMRAAMNKILSIPDLAGLSARPRSPPRMKRFCPETSPSKREPKRQKTRISPSPSLSSEETFEELRHGRMDEPAADENGDQYSEGENDREEEEFDLDAHLNSAFQRPATPPRRTDCTANKDNAPSPPVLCEEKVLLIPPPSSYPSISLAPRPVNPIPDSFSPPSQPNAIDPQTAAKTIPDNLYDYQDPWNAIGFILGLEEDNKSGRDAQSRLPEILDLSEHSAGPMSQDSSSTVSFDFSYGSSGNARDEVALDAGVDSVQLYSATVAGSQLATDTEHSTHLHDIPGRNGHPAEVDIHSTCGHENSHAATPELVTLEPLVHYHSDISTTDDDEISFPPSDAAPAIPEIPYKLSPVLRPSSPPNANPRDGSRFPKFTKFPSPVDLKGTPNPIRAVPARFPQDSFKYSPPRAPPQIRRLVMTRSPFSLERVLPQDDVEPRRAGGTEQRIFKIARIESPEVGRTIVHSGEVLQPDLLDAVHSPSNGDADDGPNVREKFFGDLCLFSDDIDAPESDG
ncbi:hypothetical protein C8F04DRAFT_436190 [Mycena alexandri]|uniref:Uncharacterized protein n=1 Tax=Mycena alexandri TaxID=1745969 RepID=A0AAD6XHL1_9AGAR|nr:hypothetical protein C8F04DRAFT_436190 [Mycena alexandri]